MDIFWILGKDKDTLDDLDIREELREGQA